MNPDVHLGQLAYLENSDFLCHFLPVVLHARVNLTTFSSKKLFSNTPDEVKTLALHAPDTELPHYSWHADTSFLAQRLPPLSTMNSRKLPRSTPTREAGDESCTKQKALVFQDAALPRDPPGHHQISRARFCRAALELFQPVPCTM